MITNVIKPKRPMDGSRWELVNLDQDQFGNDRYYYVHPEGFVAISALEVADGIIRREYIPQYHLSISKDKKRRCSSQDAQFILKQFGLSDALEDNHVHSGFVRNFWQPVDENKISMECACVDSEPAIKEDKGDFIWRPAHQD